MFKDVAAGGQTTAHGVRMLRQVIKIAFIFAILALLGTFFYRMYSRVNPDRYMDFLRYFKAIGRWDTIAVDYYSDRLDEVYAYAYKQIRPSLKVSVGVFVSIIVLFKFKGKFGKRSKKIKTKSSIRKTFVKNPFHSGFFLGKASIPKNAETSHILVTGGTGSGKTNAFHHILKQVRDKKQKAVILDTTGVFVERYYNEETDILLSSDFEKTKNWSPWADIEDLSDCTAMAKAFIPSKSSDHDSYWRDAAAVVFAALLEKTASSKTPPKKPIEHLTQKMLRDPVSKLIKAVAGTKGAAHISKEGDKATASIRSMASVKLECLELLKDTEDGDVFSITDWIKDDSQKGFLFLACTPKTRDTMRPLLSAWYSTAIRALMCLDPSFKRRIWFVNDELASMDQINGLGTCLTEGRKYGACALLAVQSPSQIVDIYGREQAKTITANCMNKIVFRENEPENAGQLSKLFGKLDIEETHEGISYGANDIRDGVTQSKVQRSKSVVSSTNIQNLRINHCYLRTNNGKIQKIKLGIAKNDD